MFLADDESPELLHKQISVCGKVYNHSNQPCFETWLMLDPHMGLIFVYGLIACFCILTEGSDDALSPIPGDKGLSNYFA